MISLLLATCIGVLKVAHDSGRSKVYFILAMAISVYAISNHWLPSVLFMLPLVFYVQGTGAFHKANTHNTATDFQEIGWLDTIVYWVISTLEKALPKLKTYGHRYGFIYCTICSFVFSLPFLYTNYLYSLPLFLWPFLVRNCTYKYKGEERWWWIATFYLFFFYSFLYFLSV